MHIKPTYRHIQQTIARCVSIMASYHDGERTPRATELLAAEVQVVAGWVMEWEQWPRKTRDSILRPVEAELLTLYGREDGGRLSALFRESFERLGREAAPLDERPHRSGESGSKLREGSSSSPWTAA